MRGLRPIDTIDPVTLARETVRAAADRVRALAMAIDVRVKCALTYDMPDELTTLGHAVQCLVRYARDGAALDAPLSEYLISVVSCEDEINDAQTKDPKTPLGQIIAAAQARDDAERGEPVRMVGLACLAGVAPSRVGQLVAGGELRQSERGYVRADDARRWLGARGVVVERVRRLVPTP